MGFLNSQISAEKEKYFDFLRMIGLLSNLFSDNNVPYLYYRIAERIFCKAFNAEDLSRSDVVADAKKGTLGVGLKTFLANNHKTFQKVAEFNNDRSAYETLSPENLIIKIAELRNTRINFTANAHALDKLIYHCVIREKGKFLIFEEPMDLINIPEIKDVKVNRGGISFNDDLHDYSFNTSKSTLFKRFITKPTIYDLEIKILKDPIEELEKLFAKNKKTFEKEDRIKQTIYLPLYSIRDGSVPEKSGLNQWNAAGRPRNNNEVYIAIPAEIHKSFPRFFPNRETPFNLKLPNGHLLKSKVCQDGGKALMSYSNRELGEWILRNVLKLKDKELLTYEKLKTTGIDSVRLDKINESEFEINFSKLGSYEVFQNSFR